MAKNNKVFFGQNSVDADVLAQKRFDLDDYVKAQMSEIKKFQVSMMRQEPEEEKTESLKDIIEPV